MNVISKHRLQLAYYLLAQGRLEESLLVFETITEKDLQTTLRGSRVTYDYMAAYLDLCCGDNGEEEEESDNADLSSKPLKFAKAR